MRFIELHRYSDGLAMLINLDEIAVIRQANHTDGALVEWRQMYQGHNPIPLPVKESYREVMASLLRIKAFAG